MRAENTIYTQPMAMEPLLPEGAKEQLAQVASAIFKTSGALSACIPSSKVRERAAGLVTE